MKTKVSDLLMKSKESSAREAKNIQQWVHHVIKPAGMLILALIWSTVRFSLANRRGESEEPEEGVEQVTCESRGTQNMNSANLHNVTIHFQFWKCASKILLVHK